jgi:hypothetical protein
MIVLVVCHFGMEAKPFLSNCFRPRSEMDALKASLHAAIDLQQTHDPVELVKYPSAGLPNFCFPSPLFVASRDSRGICQDMSQCSLLKNRKGRAAALPALPAEKP